MLVLAEQGRTQRIELIAFSPAGDSLATAGNGSWLTLWQLNAPEEPQRFFETEDRHAQVFGLAFWDNGNALIAACGCQGLRVQPIKRDSPGASATYLSGGYLRELALSPCRQRVIGINRRRLPLAPMQAQGRDGLQSWTTEGESGVRPAWLREEQRPFRFAGLAFLPGGTQFVSTQSYTLVTFDSVTGDDCQTFAHGPYQSMDQLACSPTGESLAAVSEMALVIWSVRDLSQQPRVIRNDNRKHFTGIAFHPSGKYLAATSNDETVKLYDTATWEVARAFTWDIGRMRSIAFSPDGALAAAGSDSGKVVVWDVDL